MTIKSALAAIGLVLLAAALFFGGRAFLTWLDFRPKSVAQNKRLIWSYLKQQARRSDFEKSAYDFTLKQTVADLQTNLVRFRGELGTVQTNLVQAGAEARKLRNEGLRLKDQERALRQDVRAVEVALAERQQRLTNRLSEVSATQSNLHRASTNLAALIREVDELQSLTQSLTNEITGLLANITGLNARLAGLKTNQLAQPGQPSGGPDELAGLRNDQAALQKNLSSRQQELSTARRQLTEKRSDLSTRQRSLTAVRTGAATAQTNAVVAQTNLAASFDQLAGRQASLQTKQRELETNTVALTASQKRAAELQERSQSMTRELADRQKTLRTREQELASQISAFRSDLRQKVKGASSYETIYFSIGQQLHVAERLFASKDPIEQQQGLSLAIEAAQHAGEGAENYWLAARICEACILPHLSLADEKGRTGYSPDYLLSQCNSVFERAEEMPNVIRTLRIALGRATTNAPVRMGAISYQLAYTLERTGQYDDALRLYRTVEDTNYQRQVERRISAVEDLKRQRVPRK